MNSPRYKKEEVIINFRDLLMHLMRRWRSIVIVTLAATVLAGALQYMRDYRTYQVVLNADDTKVVGAVHLEGVSLANANQVLQYQKLYETQANYNRTAPLMQINPTAVPTQTLSYFISGSTRSYAVAALYQTHLHCLPTYEDIAEDNLQSNITGAHIMELVTVSIQHDTSDSTSDHAILNIKVIAPTTEMRTIIVDAIKARMNALKSTVNKTSTHSIHLAANTEQLTVDNGLKNTQQNNLNSCNTLRNNLRSATDALTGTEKTYLEQATAIDKVDTNNAPPAKPSISLKMLILGCGLGAVLMIGIYILGYLFRKKLQSREDFVERYDLAVFGQLADDKPLSATERLIRRLFFRNEARIVDNTALVCRQLALAAKNAKTVAIIGGANKDDTLFAPLREALAAESVNLTVLPCPVYDAVALEQFSAADAVVLAETVGASTYSDIYEELALCERLERPVLGAFIIR